MIWRLVNWFNPFRASTSSKMDRRRPRTPFFRRPLGRDGWPQYRPLLEVLEGRITPAPIPTVGVPASTSALIGTNTTLNLTFQNTGNVGDVGYGPYIDLFLDTSGRDAGSPADGITTSNFSATFLGSPLPSVQFVTISGSTFVHPLTGQTLSVPGFGTRFHTGDTIAVLQLPFGSFTQSQPAAQIQVALGSSNKAAVGTPLPFSAIGGFRFGADALDNPGTDPPIRGAQADGSLTPQLYLLQLSYLGPESETATGPSFRQRYELDAIIAPGQTINSFTLSDPLDSSMQYDGSANVVTKVNGATVAANLTSQPSTSSPGGTLTNNFGTVTGNGGVSASLQFEFFVTRDKSGNPATPVVPQGTNRTQGDDTGSATGTWTSLNPLDPPNQSVPQSLPPNAHVLNQDSIATQKTVTVVDKTTLASTGSIIPGQTLLRYDIYFQFSDYFAFQDVSLEDYISDGQRVFVRTTGNSTVPTLQVNNAYNTTSSTRSNSASAAFSGTSTIDYQELFTTLGSTTSDPTAAPDSATEPEFNVLAANPGAQGQSYLDFHISDELIARGFTGGLLVGGNIANGGGSPQTGGPSSYGSLFSGTTGHIVFYTEVKQNFSDDYPSGDRSVDELDTLSNQVPDIQGQQLKTTDLSTVIGTGSDNTAASVSIPIGTLTKSIYAVNGSTSNVGNPVVVQPGDLVTYELTYTLPLSGFEDLKLTDFPPLPVFPVPAAITFDSAAAPGTIPTANTVTLGPNDTFFSTVHPLGMPVDAATAANLGASYDSTGGSDGAGEFTGAPTTVDGVTLADSDRVLVKDQADLRQNGIYVVVDAASGTWDRASDFDTQALVLNSKLFRVTGGTANAGQHFLESNKLFTTFNDTAQGNDTNITWAQFLTTDQAGNSFTANFGTFDDVAGGDRSSVIDMLVTLPVADAAFAQPLFLTNQAHATEGSTNAGSQTFNQIVMFDVVTPTVSIAKGVVGYNSTGLTLGGLTFTAPGTASNFSGGPLYTASQATAIAGSDLTLSTPVDAHDKVRFGVVLQNQGLGDTYDVTFGDTIPTGFDAPATAGALVDPSGGALTVRRGDGTLLSNSQLVTGYVRVATSADLGATYSSATNNGQLTGAPGIIDGITLSLNDRVLVKDQVSQTQNGIYVVTAIDNSNPANPLATLTRASDADTNTEISGYVVAVYGGATNADKFFTANGSITLNTTNIVWTAGATIPDYYYTYDSVGRSFTISLTDQYSAGNTNATPPDTHTGSLSRGQSGSPSSPVAVTNGSNSVIVTYDLVLSSNVAPDAQLTNTASVLNEAKSQGGPNGPDPTDPATVTVRLPIVSKTLVSTEVNAVGNNNVQALPFLAQATIGELASYSVTVSIPEGVTPSAQLVDTLDTGLAFVGLTNVQFSNSSLSSSTGLTFANNGATDVSTLNSNLSVNGAGNQVTFSLGDLTNTDTDNSFDETITLTYQAVVLNTLGNQAGGTRNNSARFSWQNNATTVAAVKSGQQTNTSGSATGTATPVTLVEPTLSVAKLVKNVTTGTSFQASVRANAGDTVSYQVTITNSTAASDTTAFNLAVSDPIPSLIPTPSLTNVASTGTIRFNGTTRAATMSDFVISSGTLTVASGLEIDMQKNSTITLTFGGTYGGATGLSIANTADVRWTSLAGNPGQRSTYSSSSTPRTGADGLLGSGALNDYDVQSTATVIFPPLVRKSIVATSEPATTPANPISPASGVTSGVQAAIGEIIRYRIYVAVGQGTTSNFQIEDNIPTGLRFLNDGSARYGFLSDNGSDLTSSGITNINGLGSGAGITGSGTNLPTLTSSALTGSFGDSNIATAAAGAGTGDPSVYNDGQAVFFRFGDLTNNDRTNNGEFIVLEFNALVDNTNGNRAGTGRSNNFSVLVDTDGNGTPGYISVVQDTNGNGVGDAGDTSVAANDPSNNGSGTPANSNNATLTIAEPSVSIQKHVIATTGAVVTYKVTVTNASGANVVTAYDVRTVDQLDGVNLSLVSGTVTSFSPGSGFTNNTSGNKVDVAYASLAPGASYSFQYKANVLTVPTGSTTLNNTANITFTSLPGTSGTGGSWTGNGATSTTVPGSSGSATGERNGQDGVGELNNYVASATVRLGSVGDRIYMDLNANGVQDAGEPGIVGAPVTVIYDPTGTGNFSGPSVSTFTVNAGANGNYVAGGIPVGGLIKISVPSPLSGMNVTDAVDDGVLNATNSSTLTLSAGTPNPRNQDFGYRGSGTLGDRVWLDTNNDGEQDNNGLEPNLPGVTVTLIWAGLDGQLPGDPYETPDDITFTTITTNPANNQNPNYLFQNLPAGIFRVAVPAPGSGGVPGNLALTDSVDDNVINPLASVDTTLTTAQHRTDMDFGFWGTANVGQTVWYDVDGNAAQNNAEPGISGVTVKGFWAGPDNTLGTADDVTFTTTTDANGHYLFPHLPVLGAGSGYRVTVTPPAQYATQTYDADGLGTPNQSTLTLGPSQTNLLQNFGYRGPVTQGLSGMIWDDINLNGLRDAGEPGDNAITVQLYDTTGTKLLATTTTAGGGLYSFPDLVAGNYKVRFVPPWPRIFTKANVGGNPATESQADPTTGFTGQEAVPVGGFRPNVNAGLQHINQPPVVTLPPASPMPCTNENANLVFSTVNGNAVTISDPDAGNQPLQVTLMVTNGTFTLSRTTGLTFTSGTGTNNSIMVFRGTLANLNAALQGLIYTPAPNFIGVATFTATVNDLGNQGIGGSQSDSKSVPICVDAVLDPPIVVNPGPLTTPQATAFSFTTCRTGPIIIQGVYSTDTLQVTLTATHGTLTLMQKTGLTFLSGTGTGDPTMTFQGTQAPINLALYSLVFTPDPSYSGPASITVTVKNLANSTGGGPQTTTSIVALSITQKNQPPSVTLPGTQTAAEDTPVVFSTGTGNAISVADPDNNGQPVQVMLAAVHGTLTLASNTGLTFVSGGLSGSSVVVMKGTLANINAALNGLRFIPQLHYAGSTSLVVSVNDLGSPPMTAGGSVPLTFTAVNQSPVITAPGALSTPAGIDLVFGYGKRIIVADPDGSISQEQVTITVTHGRLYLGSTIGITFVAGFNGNGTMTIKGTLAMINNALNGLHFRPTPGYTGLATLSLLADDLGNSGAGGAQTGSASVSITVF